MLPNQDIQRYGGKAAILNHIRDNTQLPIPRYLVKEAGASLSSVLSSFESMKKPVIVRSSSSYEYANFEGIFESVKDVTDQHSLEQAIERVEESAMSERAQTYAKQNGYSIDEKIHVIVQEQSPSPTYGAMMRHPNNPNLIFISVAGGAGIGIQLYHSFLWDERTKSRAENNIFKTSLFETKDAEFLVEQYKQIEVLKEIAEDYALFVEFGMDPFFVYQVRPFKKIQVADFKLPDEDGEMVLKSDLVFGVTPPDGVVLPVLRSFGRNHAYTLGMAALNPGMHRGLIDSFNFGLDEMDLPLTLSNICGTEDTEEDKRFNAGEFFKSWNLYMDRSMMGQPYCFMSSSAEREYYDVDLSVPNMQALLLGEPRQFLVHNLMRLIKKAEVAICFDHLFIERFFKETTSYERPIRIISNGREGLVKILD